MQVEINHPHAKAIAAFYSGKGVRRKDSYGSWLRYPCNMVFNAEQGYEIEPEVVIKYSAGYITTRNGTVFAAEEFDCIEKASSIINNPVCVCKKTYTDGVLTALELVEINNV